MSLSHDLEPAEDPASAGGFAVSLTNFQGPFDLLLSLIAKKEMDVTELALAEVTDEFLAYTFRLAENDDDDGPGAARSIEDRLEERTSFLVIAATLLDLKAARLLPSAEVESLEDVEALEARDLLFAKLLQYQAFKRAAEDIAGRLTIQAQHVPREVRKGEGFDDLLPPLEFRITPEMLAQIAERALSENSPAEPPAVRIDHLHGSTVTVAGELETMARRLTEAGRLTFRDLTEDADSRLVLVVRFLALLELYRQVLVELSQDEEHIWVTWTGPAELENLSDVEEYEGASE